MIAHAGGLPLEETLAQLAPMVSGAALALGLLLGRARSWVRSFDPRDGSRSRRSVVDVSKKNTTVPLGRT